MKPEELRIGNYFQWSGFASMGKGIGQITHGQQIMDYIEFKEGVTLTEEWLLKFGFKKHNEYWDLNEVLYDMGGIGSIASDMTIYQSPDVQNYYSCYMGNYDTRLKYVHQLQNLYYALTGKELMIK